jgi:succinate dehydrogenase / fumarate reductase cytochrome b subunit
MKCFFNFIKSSIGKKQIMAITGLGFCGFLAGHLAGNLKIYAGEETFNTYAERLHSLGALLKIAEIGLLVFAILHVSTGAMLVYGNFRARPKRYKVKKSAGGRSIGSATMPYTGLLLLSFVILHLVNFHFADKSQQAIFQIVAETFSNPGYIAVYIFAMIIAGIHVSHGFWSAFQTIGLNHPEYMPLVRVAGTLFSLIVAAGFGLIPVYVYFIF